MTDTAKILAQGQVSDSAASIYNPGAGVQAIIKAIVFVNVTGSDATVEVYANGTADANIIHNEVNLVADGGKLQFDGVMALDGDSSDELHAVSDTASAITYTIFGAEIN